MPDSPKPIRVITLPIAEDDVEMAKPFIAWDGEGITYLGDVQQSYCLFGASTGDRVISRSLSTVQCLDLMLAVEAKNPSAIHVIFSGNYDVNMIMKDLPTNKLDALWAGGYVKWNHYRLHYIPGKWLSVSRAEVSSGSKTRISMKLFDVFSFFQMSFVKTIAEYLPKDDPEVARIVAGKARRKEFQWKHLHTVVVPYWETELRMLVQVMDALRSDLTAAGLTLKSWHGPGAVANVAFAKHGIAEVKGNDIPSEVTSAARYAFAGGRFELFRVGHYPGRVYEYDINSAYPSIIATLPNLRNGYWRYTNVFEPTSFGVWEISFPAGPFRPVELSDNRANPFFCREKRGTISFPNRVETWAWTPEASLSPASVTGGWIFVENDPSDRPFSFVQQYYETRRQWKLEGNSAQRALKLTLNSLYGKMAQRVGWNVDTMEPPKWHQLEWAGYVTSSVRALLYRAYLLAPNSVVAMETDAIFSTTPLPLTVGKELGQWELSTLDNLTYIQSGFYFATNGETGEEIAKYRGFDSESLSHRIVLDYLYRLDRHERPTPVLYGPTSRFVGYPSARITKAVWRSWESNSRQILLGGGEKRSHIKLLCPECIAGLPLCEGLHTQLVPEGLGGLSEPHPLPWEVAREVALDDLQASDGLL